MNLVSDIIVFAALSIILVSSTPNAFADTIFVDPFDKDPQANGWTEKIVKIAVGNFPATATGVISPTGEGEVVLAKTGGASALELSITRTINTIGFENIELELIAKQSQGNYENVDFILIEYSTGNGFQTLLKDHEVWNGINDLIGEGTDAADGNMVLTSTGDLSLSSDADENSSLMVRLTVFTDEINEDIFFGNFMIKGDIVVEEPVDEEPPVLFTPADITQGNDLGAAGAIVSFVVTATDNSGPVTVTCSPDSDTFFSLGSTTVTCNATDPTGNSDTMSFTVTVNDEEPPPPPPPASGATDHYLGYKVKETKHTEKFQKLTVTLSDHFEKDAVYKVEKPERLFNPVDKNQEGIIDEITHLLGYKIKAPKGEKFEKVTNVHVTNQFGELIIDVKKPKLLLVPSSKDLTETPDKLDSITVNHYKCYDVKKTKDTPKFKKLQVTLSDPNFGETKVFDVKKPKHLCTPVDKDGEGIIDKESHLMCYDLKKIKDEPKFKKRNVFTNNQFEPEDLEVKKEHQLCLPSIIDIL